MRPGLLCGMLSGIILFWMAVMEYIVFDLEWNQSGSKAGEREELPCEIVEIGAVKLDASFQARDEFSVLVRPVVYRELNRRTQELIGLTEEELREGRPFREAAERFLDWCGADSMFCTWGDMDLTEFQRNMQFFGVKPRRQGVLKYYDVQKLFAISQREPKEQRSLEYAAQVMELSEAGPFHRALSDARYTAEIFRRLDKSCLSNYSTDYYRCPGSREEEIRAVFSTYSKYISMGFSTTERVMADKEVASTRCCVCGKPAKRRIRWFSWRSGSYYCLAWCREHGWLRGKIRIKKAGNGKLFAVKTIKRVSEEEADAVRKRQEQMRQQRRQRRQRRKRTKREAGRRDRQRQIAADTMAQNR